VGTSDTTDRVEKLVQEIEEQSSAEIVVCFHQSACSYRDLDLIWGILFALAVLAYKIWSPFVFDPDWVLFNVVVFGCIGFFLSRGVSGVRRLFLSGGRRSREVQRVAEADFTRLGVSKTERRTGLLLSVSRFERSITLVPDLALEEKIAPRLWDDWNNQYQFSLSGEKLLDNLEELLQALKAPLARQLPVRDDDVNELPDRPVEAS